MRNETFLIIQVFNYVSTNISAFPEMFYACGLTCGLKALIVSIFTSVSPIPMLELRHSGILFAFLTKALHFYSSSGCIH